MAISKQTARKVYLGVIGALALVGVMSNPAQATIGKPAEYEYVLNAKNTQVEETITKEVCTHIGAIAAATKGLFDKGFSDLDIQATLMSAGLDKLSDRSQWIAFSEMIPTTSIEVMRAWPNDSDFKWMREATPGMDPRWYYQTFGEYTCTKKLGEKVKVLKVERIPVKKP